MVYANIPEEVLNIELNEFYNQEYGFSRHTLRNELDVVDEHILHAEFDISEKDSLGYPILNNFTAWTENYVLQLIRDQFDEQNLIVIPRHPSK